MHRLSTRSSRHGGRSMRIHVEPNWGPNWQRCWKRIRRLLSGPSTHDSALPNPSSIRAYPELRREIGLRHQQYQRQQAQARRDAVRVEIREIVRLLHAQGICPSVPRVTSRLKRAPCGNGGYREGGKRRQGGIDDGLRFWRPRGSRGPRQLSCPRNRRIPISTLRATFAGPAGVGMRCPQV